MSYGNLLGMALLVVAAWGQTVPNPSPAEETHYPRVIHADLPLYPALGWALQLTGTVEIQVVVEKGAVVNAEVKSVVLGPTRDRLNEEGKKKVGSYLSDPALANLKTWQFQQEDSGIFTVRYIYRIEGEPTLVSGNPNVELDLPLLVKITARPLKLVCMDCGANISGSPVR
jgi:hypothetical protein